MAQAFFGVALWLCIALTASAAAPAKKQPSWAELSAEQQQVLLVQQEVLGDDLLWGHVRHAAQEERFVRLSAREQR